MGNIITNLTNVDQIVYDSNRLRVQIPARQNRDIGDREVAPIMGVISVFKDNDVTVVKNIENITLVKQVKTRDRQKA